MKVVLPVLILIVTVGLIGIAWIQSGGLAMHEMRSAGTPQEAVEALMTDIQARDWDRAYARLANNADHYPDHRPSRVAPHGRVSAL